MLLIERPSFWLMKALTEGLAIGRAVSTRGEIAIAFF